MSDLCQLTRAYATGCFGQLHYVTAGSGSPVLLLHQTPRSSDEYRELIPLLATRYRVIAMDTPGFGGSGPPPAHTIENYAAAALSLLECLHIDRTVVLGHHTGGVIAMELAARAPEMVGSLVLSSTPYVDAAARARRALRPPIDHYVVKEDGSHLADAWRGRQSFYPQGRPDLLDRFIRDLLVPGPTAELGHKAVSAYRMENTIAKIACPVLCIGATSDTFSYPELSSLVSGLAQAEIAVIDGGKVALMEERAADVADAVLRFLS